MAEGNDKTTHDLSLYTREEMREACRNNYNAAIDACLALTESCWPEADDLLERMRGLRH